MILFLELMDDTFFVTFSQVETLSDGERFDLGTLLNIDESIIRPIINETTGATFKLLKTWKSSAKNNGNSTSLFTQLSEACVTINKVALVGYVLTRE